MGLFNNIKEDLPKQFSIFQLMSILGIDAFEESKDDTLCAKLVQTKDKIKTFSPTKKSYIRVRGLLEDLN